MNLRRPLLVFTVLFTFGMSNFARAEAVDPALIQALKQATHDIQERTTDLNSLTWLATMSDKIKQRIPNPFYRVRLLEAVYSEANRAGLDPHLVLAVIDIESNFDRYAKSHVGAQGLMQVMPFWKEVYGNSLDDLYNPLVSLRYGCTILRHYMDKHSDPVRALAAYNGSLGRTKYPDKVFSKLKKQWTIKKDKYSRTVNTTDVVSNELSITDQLILN
jgi:soluble lytic murein transglycosylase-like protein